MTAEYQVRARKEQFRGRVFRVVSDEVTMPGGGYATRDYVLHIGAVGVVAVDDEGRIVLVRQYRHAVGQRMWELPAGLIDVPGEPLANAAARELAEEADLIARRWDLLVDVHPTPGCSNEIIRLFHARDLAPVPAADRFDRHDEEADLEIRRFDLAEAVDMVLGGEITNAAAMVGVLAISRVREHGAAASRPLSTPLPREALEPVTGTTQGS